LNCLVTESEQINIGNEGLFSLTFWSILIVLASGESKEVIVGTALVAVLADVRTGTSPVPTSF
jgi:hypothetical protein